MAGHILSVFLDEKQPSFPYIALIVSGGTSSIYLATSYNRFQLLGRTRDDAAGEAFDKVAKLLGLPLSRRATCSKESGVRRSKVCKIPQGMAGKKITGL